jgi:hypothetical protein
MRIPGFAALALLAACGSRTPAPPEEPPSPDTIACRAEVRHSPDRARIMQQRTPGNANNEARVTEELQTAERRVFLDCMRRRGAIPQSGGVEARR